MSDVYFKASLQNTLNPEVGTFNNVKDKEGTFTLEDGEYYLTNNTSNSYGVYYPTKDIYSTKFTIEFDLNYPGSSGFEWCLVFNGDDSTYWFGIGIWETALEFRGQTLPNYHLITSPNTWLHVKCIFDYDRGQNYVDIYIDNVQVNNFIISKKYGIKYIDLLGNSGGFASRAKIKNIIIYDNSNKHYLDTTGLTSLWSKIKSLFATKTELASKANTSDLNKYYTRSEVDNLLNNIGSGTEGGDDAQNVLKSWPNGAEAHNAMWGGRDITAAFNNGTVSANIANGTFRDIFPGDFIKTDNNYWVIADCDYWIDKGDTPMKTHHVVILPMVRHLFYRDGMNHTNTTEGGYANSSVFKDFIPLCSEQIVNELGADHILTFRDLLTDEVDTSLVPSGLPHLKGAASRSNWYSTKCNLMSEHMVYGMPIYSSSGLDAGVATRQFSAFRMATINKVLGDAAESFYWLRDVASSEEFTLIDGITGCPRHIPAANWGQGKPFALLK